MTEPGYTYYVGEPREIHSLTPREVFQAALQAVILTIRQHGRVAWAEAALAEPTRHAAEELLKRDFIQRDGFFLVPGRLWHTIKEDLGQADVRDV